MACRRSGRANRKTMRLEALIYLVDFADLGTIAAVAKKNHMTEQGMGRVFRQLENDLNLKIFRKSGRFLQLTEAGYSLVDQAKGLVADYGKLQDIVRSYVNMAELGDRRVSVFVTPLVAMSLLPLLPLCEPFAYDVSLSIREESLESFVSGSSPLRSDDNSMAIISIPPTKSARERLDSLGETHCEYFSLGRCPVVALISASSPLVGKAAASPICAEDLHKFGLGIASPKDDAILLQLSGLAKDDDVRLVTNNMQIIKRQIRHGKVVIFLPEIIMNTFSSGRGITSVRFAHELGDSSSSMTDNDDPTSQFVEFGLALHEKMLEESYVREIVCDIISTIEGLDAIDTRCASQDIARLEEACGC